MNSLSCPWHHNYWSGLFTISCTVSVVNTSYLVLFSVNLDQITPLNLLPLPSLILFNIVWIKDQRLLDTVFIDLRRVFDSVDHNLLINKLELYGLENTELNWFKSFLSDCKQVASVGKETSDYCPIMSGVPQGSILGPLLCLLFTNDRTRQNCCL